jgi:hypothetical protein
MIKQVSGLDAPAFDFFPVTPNDDNDLAAEARGLSWAVDGALVIVTPAGETRTIPAGALQTGVVHPIRAVRVKATGTTATGIIAYT